MAERDDLDDLLRCSGEPHQTQEVRNKHPSGFEPGVRWKPGGDGEVVAVVPPGQDPRWQEELERFGFGGLADVLEVVEVRAWESPSRDDPSGVKTLHYVKARCRRTDERAIRADVDALCEEIAQNTYEPPPKVEGDTALVVPLADWQAGKSCAGGPEGLKQRVLVTIDHLETMLRARPVARLVLMGMGDMVESCTGHYDMQTFQVAMTDRDQDKFVRRLLVRAVERLAPLVPSLVLATVPGNHGENRKNGRSFTDWGDNRDVTTFETAAEVLAANPAFSHVSAVIPDRELTVTLDVLGTAIAFAHSHQASGQGDKVLSWWEGMQNNRHPVGDCDMLVTGHFHHLRVRQHGPRWWIQCPALDGDHPRKGVPHRQIRSGSEWWAHRGGSSAPAATVAFYAGRDCGPFGWDGLRLIA